MGREAQKETVRAAMGKKSLNTETQVAKVTDAAGGSVGRAGEYLSSFRNSISPHGNMRFIWQWKAFAWRFARHQQAATLAYILAKLHVALTNT